MVILGEHLPLGAQAPRDRVVDGARSVLRRLLRDPRDADVRREPELAVVEVDPAGEHAEQRRLAGAVAADQPDALARIELERHVVQQRAVAEGEAGVSERGEWHRLQALIRGGFRSVTSGARRPSRRRRRGPNSRARRMRRRCDYFVVGIMNSAPARMPDGQRCVTAFCRV